ncbi:MAG TPA: M14 family zinc carboxypeptidase [Candidatus Paceibacterota bacterium]|nr:M14 family zinc carboxypeptidase [Candidatus Paceibacterota bacterium]
MRRKRFGRFSLAGSIVIILLLVSAYALISRKIILLPGDDAFSENAMADESGPVPIQVKVFGTSATGKTITGYEIGTGPDCLLLIGAIHGDEMGTAALLHQLISAIEQDPGILPPSKKVVIIPIANPEGYYDRTDKLNNDGVNLNLNFDTTSWQEYGPEGTYAGPEPFSEPESRLIRQVVEEYNPYAMISFHAQGGLVSPEDNEVSQEWGRWYAAATGYDYFDGWEYAGTATAWFVEQTDRPAITVELHTNLGSDWDINKDALLKLIGTVGVNVPN